MLSLSEPICQEIVSILRAIFFGADGACVMLDMPSTLMALVPFVLGVFFLQWIARRLVAKAMGKRASTEQASEKTGPFDVKYDGGPIKSNKGLW